MRKATRNQVRGMGWLTAGSLALALAAFGCSSNQYAGNGQPSTVTPTINSVNHSGTMGSSSGTEGLPPMSSSYSNPASYNDPATPRVVDVDALAKLAAQRGFRGVVLGPSDPGGIQQGVTVASGQFTSPANAVMPQSTVNSSINSQPTPVITGGDIAVVASVNPSTAGGSSVTGVGAVDTTGGGATIGTTAAATTTPTASAATSALTASTGAPTVAGSAAFSPALMNSTPAPQATGTTGPTLKTVVATAGRGTINGTTAATRTTTGTTAARSAVRSTSATTNVNVVSGIQLQTGANGAIMMTNVAVPAVKGTTAAAPAVKGK